MYEKYQVYFEFIRFSLDATHPYREAFRTIDWAAFLAFCNKQTLTGVCFDGVVRLGKGQGPQGGLLIQWIDKGQSLKLRNMQVNADALKVCEQLTRSGMRYSVLKGQGNARMYPNPYSRTPGDIDVWLYGASRREVMDYVRTNYGEVGEIVYQHVCCKYGSSSVELHVTPTTVNCPWHNRRLQRFFREHGAEQCAHFVELPGGKGKIAAPTDYFNAVYQLSHIYHHFFIQGIGLRQMLDYYFVIRRLSADERLALSRELRPVGLYRFAGAVMYVLHRVFGLPVEEMPVPIDERRGRVLLEEILDGGNFGRDYSKYGAFTRQGAFKKFFLRVYRMLHFVRFYPAEALSEPVFRTWHWAWRALYRCTLPFRQ